MDFLAPFHPGNLSWCVLTVDSTATKHSLDRINAFSLAILISFFSHLPSILIHSTSCARLPSDRLGFCNLTLVQPTEGIEREAPLFLILGARYIYLDLKLPCRCTSQATIPLFSLISGRTKKELVSKPPVRSYYHILTCRFQQLLGSRSTVGERGLKSVP